MVNELSINKRILWRHINKKIHRSIHHFHVFSILSILLDEMVKDLKQGKIVKIHNFGSFVLKELKPRRYFDVKQKQVMLSRGYKILRFILPTPIRKKLIAHLDLDKTLKGD